MDLKNLRSLDKPDLGLLLLRLIVGGLMVGHGVGKFMGGTETFEHLGQSMAIFGLDFGYAFWGFMAALIETVGGFFVVIGYLFRLSSFLVYLVMVVAIAMHLDQGDAILGKTAHAIVNAAVFLALMFTGPGKYAVRRA